MHPYVRLVHVRARQCQGRVYPGWSRRVIASIVGSWTSIVGSGHKVPVIRLELRLDPSDTRPGTRLMPVLDPVFDRLWLSWTLYLTDYARFDRLGPSSQVHAFRLFCQTGVIGHFRQKRPFGSLETIRQKRPFGSLETFRQKVLISGKKHVKTSRDGCTR